MNTRTMFKRLASGPNVRVAFQLCIITAGAAGSSLQPATTLAASASATAALPLTATAQAAAANSSKTVVRVNSKGLGAELTANFSDSCTTGGVRVDFNASATRDTSSTPKKASTSGVLIYLYGWNACTQTQVYNVAGVDIPYAVQQINGRTLPVTVTLSAQNFPNVDGTDTVLSFQMTINGIAPQYTQVVDEWDIYDGTPTTRVHTVRSGSQANVTGTLSISTQHMGVIPISGDATGQIFDSQSNIITITR